MGLATLASPLTISHGCQDTEACKGDERGFCHLLEVPALGGGRALRSDLTPNRGCYKGDASPYGSASPSLRCRLRRAVSD